MRIIRNLITKISFRSSQWLQNGMRNSHSGASDTKNLGVSQVKELSIPTAYGTIAAKAWGSESGKPILAFHGWLDNCGTFDKLFPLLNEQFYIVAVDAPGCGLSSHKPPGCLYSDLDTVLEYKKVVEFLGWKKFSLIGHSLGGAMSLFYSSLYPDLVDKIVTIDISKILSLPIESFPQIISNSLDEYVKLEKKLTNSPPVYTPESAAKRLIEGMHNEITLEGAEILLKRGSRPSDCGKGVIFTRDLRCRPVEFLNIKNHELIFQYSRAIKSEIMLIMASNPAPYYRGLSEDIKNKAYEIYRVNAKRFVLEHVEGNHFVHLNSPERVAPLINKFLTD